MLVMLLGVGLLGAGVIRQRIRKGVTYLSEA
jgi:hypothetical protein